MSLTKSKERQVGSVPKMIWTWTWKLQKPPGPTSRRSLDNLRAGAVKDSGATSNVEPGPSAAAQTEHGEDATTPKTSRPSNRAPIESVGDSDCVCNN